MGFSYFLLNLYAAKSGNVCGAGKIEYMKFSLVLIYCLLTSSASSQEKTQSINCIIQIDEGIVQSLTGEFEFLNSDGIFSKFDFGYEYGEIRLSLEDYNKLHQLDDNLKLTMKMKYIDMGNENQKIYLYTKKIEIIDLRQRYVLFRIYNCKKDGCSRVYIETPRYHNPYPEPKRKKALNCKRYLAPKGLGKYGNVPNVSDAQ